MPNNSNISIIDKYKYIDSTFNEYISNTNYQIFGSRNVTDEIIESDVLRSFIKNQEQPERESCVSTDAFNNDHD